jgi:hypothetical protein
MHEYFVPYGNGAVSPFVVGRLYNWKPTSSHFYFDPKMNPVMLLKIKRISVDLVDVYVLTAQAEIDRIRVHEMFYDDWKAITKWE